MNARPHESTGMRAQRRTEVIAIATILLGLLLVAPPAGADHDGSSGSRYRDAIASATGGVVASISDYASAVGIDVLNRGGNAIDAAVAMVFAVGVARPDFGGIGGGGFLVYRSAGNELAALDFRETAPADKRFDAEVFSGPGMHSDTNDAGDEVASGHRVIGVPAVVAGMDAALEDYGSGTFTLGELITNGCPPARPCVDRPPYAHELARDGVTVTFDLAAQLFSNHSRVRYYPETADIYGDTVYGAPLVQEDYANSLALIARHGKDAFYGDGGGQFTDASTGQRRDSIAKLIADDMATAEDRSRTNPALQARWPDTPTDPDDGPHDTGYLTVDDFQDYRPVWRTPLTSTFRGHRIVAMPPPTSGGIATIEILNLLAGFPLASNSLDTSLETNADTSWARSSANHLHVLAEAQKLAWVDRAAYVADPDFRYDFDGDGLAEEEVPTSTLTSRGYANERRGEIDLETAQFDYQPGVYQTSAAAAELEPSHTNHLSVIDGHGNAVAVTTSMGAAFGSAVVAEGTGFVLNNELDDFTRDARSPNAPAPGKRPRSSQSPTIVVRDGKPVLVVGAAGGATIPLGVVQLSVNVAAFGLDIAHAIDAERIEAATFTDANDKPVLAIESAAGTPQQRIPEAVLDELGGLDELGARGHVLWHYPDLTQENTGYFQLPIVEAVGFNRAKARREAVSDPRNEYDYFDPSGRTYGQGAAAQ